MNKAAVTSGLVTQTEYDQIVVWLSESLPFESQGRVRQVQLIARAHAITAAQKLGRSGATMGLLRALASPLPRLWEALNEQEENSRNMEEDLLLDDGTSAPPSLTFHHARRAEIAFVVFGSLSRRDRRVGGGGGPSCLRTNRDDAVRSQSGGRREGRELAPHERASSVAEGAGRLQDVPDVSPQQISRWDGVHRHCALPHLFFFASPHSHPIPPYTIHDLTRASPLQNQTVGNDASTTLRFLGYLSAVKEITPGLGVFCRKQLSEWTQDWLNALSEKGLKFSTLANYCNSLCMVGQFVYQTYEVDEDALSMQPASPLDEILRLRGQCESQAKQQALYSRRDPLWLEFPEAQKGRVKAEAAYRALPASPPGRKKQALKEWLIMALHTCAPPDRVGVIRRLRLGMTLKLSGDDGFVLDLTSARSHKTSRFHGPTIQTLSTMLNEPLSLYCTEVEFDGAGNETRISSTPLRIPLAACRAHSGARR